MTARTADARSALPPALAEALAGYEEHLRTQRDLSEHTVRGYVGDAVWLLDHLVRRGGTRVDDLDLATLRSWLAQGRTRGAGRATTARRAAAARSFTAWLRRAGLTPEDVGLRLVSPKAQRTLPDVLAPDQARVVVESAAGADEPAGLRDAVVLELLYASGVRVSELVGLDIDDVDRGRRLLRVLGKGRKERSVPYGAPAERALDACPVRNGVSPERLARVAGCDVLDVLRVLPALELADLVEVTDAGWRLARAARAGEGQG